MPGPVPQLTLQEARDHVRRRCFEGAGGDMVGLETEWLVSPEGDPAGPVPFERLCAAMARAGPTPAGSVVTYEPGGQLELSSPPSPTVGIACQTMAVDVAWAKRVTARHGLSLAGEGQDPHRRPR